MTPNERLLVLFSIIVGLGLTELLSSFHHLLLMPPVLLYLMATSVLPDVEPGDNVDLGGFYMANRHRFFAFAATYTGVLWLALIVTGESVSAGSHVWAARGADPPERPDDIRGDLGLLVQDRLTIPAATRQPSPTPPTSPPE